MGCLFAPKPLYGPRVHSSAPRGQSGEVEGRDISLTARLSFVSGRRVPLDRDEIWGDHICIQVPLDLTVGVCRLREDSKAHS